MPFQHYQWICLTAEGRTQAVPGQGVAAAAQGQVSGAVSRPAGLLRRPVPVEGPDADGGGDPRPAQVLAQDVQLQGGHVHQ